MLVVFRRAWLLRSCEIALQLRRAAVYVRGCLRARRLVVGIVFLIVVVRILLLLGRGGMSAGVETVGHYLHDDVVQGTRQAG